MASSTISPDRQFEHDHETWENLKQAIAASSGFNRWQQERTPEVQSHSGSLDERVSCYLRETLETLAY
ncbi:MAG: hypothetical protein ACRDEA_21715 [Microcystaceae cyanobacterium]